MHIISHTVHAGATAPFTLVHISDNHLTLADTRDNARKLALAAARQPEFAQAAADLSAAAAYAKAHGAIIVHTGDLIDFVSYANLDAAKKFTDENDCMMAAGNHEYSQYVGEAVEDAAYREQSLARVQAAFKNDIRFSARTVNGVNLVSMDNGYYQIEAWQLARLQTEIGKGLPLILLMHTPLYEQGLRDFVIGDEPHKPAYLMAAPEDTMRAYTPERYAQQKADETTRAAVDLIAHTPLIKAVLTGHLHCDYETRLYGFLPQYTAGIGTLHEVCID